MKSMTDDQPRQPPAEKSELENMLKSLGKHSALTEAFATARSDDARKRLIDKSGDYVREYIAETAKSAGITPEQAESEFYSPDVKDDERFRALQADAISKAAMRRSESADYAVKNLDKILDDPAEKADFSKRIKNDKLLGRLARIADDDKDHDAINEYAQYIALGKQIDTLDRYIEGHKEPDKKKGREFLAQISDPRLRDRIEREAIQTAVAEKMNELRAAGKNYDEETLRAVAQSEQIRAQLIPSAKSVLKAAQKVRDEMGKEYTDPAVQKEKSNNFADAAKRVLLNAFKSGKAGYQSEALNLIYAAYAGDGKALEADPYERYFK